MTWLEEKLEALRIAEADVDYWRSLKAPTKSLKRFDAARLERAKAKVAKLREEANTPPIVQQ